jgi:hypothetical protein
VAWTFLSLLDLRSILHSSAPTYCGFMALRKNSLGGQMRPSWTKDTFWFGS